MSISQQSPNTHVDVFWVMMSTEFATPLHSPMPLRRDDHFDFSWKQFQKEISHHVLSVFFSSPMHELQV
jgi:hypothetical protein